MLPRVLEPEVMDSPDEAADYDAMDHAEVNRRFVDDVLQAGLTDENSGQHPNDGGVNDEPSPIDVLDLGCGTAQIPIELCRRNPRVRVLAVDLADEMLRVARL